MDLYKSILRPLLFRLDAERAHELAKTGLRRERLWSLAADLIPVRDDRLETELAGIRLLNPVGLAAGFDKNCDMLATMASLGFGYVIPGSIREGVASDNPKPRILRYEDRESLINCTGFPSRGATYAAQRLERFRQSRLSERIAIIPNITGFTIEEYVKVLTAVQPYADAVEVSLSCPNERYDEFDFLYPATFERLMDALNRSKQRPFLLKIRNYNDEKEKENRFKLVELALQHGVDAITLPGSHVVTEPRLSLGRGNLGGRAVFNLTLQNIRDVRAVTGPKFPIKALGGIFSAEDAYRTLRAGATSIELLTGLVYEGVGVARRINAGLIELMDTGGFPNVKALIGSEAEEPAPSISDRENA